MLLHKYTTDCGRRLGDIHTHTIIFVALCPFLGSEAGRSLRTLNLEQRVELDSVLKGTTRPAVGPRWVGCEEQFVDQ
jgi:hypothetical protein